MSASVVFGWLTLTQTLTETVSGWGCLTLTSRLVSKIFSIFFLLLPYYFELDSNTVCPRAEWAENTSLKSESPLLSINTHTESSTQLRSARALTLPFPTEAAMISPPDMRNRELHRDTLLSARPIKQKQKVVWNMKKRKKCGLSTQMMGGRN